MVSGGELSTGGNRIRVLVALIAGAVGLLLALPGGSALASSGEITRAEANADWTLGAVAGSLSWGDCEWAPGKAGGCHLLPYLTVGASECSATERLWPRSDDAWIASESSDRAGSDSFDLSEVPLSGEPGQLACLMLLEFSGDPITECSGLPFEPEPPLIACLPGTAGVHQPPRITVLGPPTVLAEAPLTRAGEGPPTIESESVSGVTETDAVLEADINPGDLATSYQFRLAYGCGFTWEEACPQYCKPKQPCPGPWNSVITVSLLAGDLPPSTETMHVSLDLSSVGVTLQPYKYRYSVVATNAHGSAEGSPQYFTPPLSPRPSQLQPSTVPSGAPPSSSSGATGALSSTPSRFDLRHRRAHLRRDGHRRWPHPKRARGHPSLARHKSAR